MRRFIGLLLLAVMVVSVLSGCGVNQKSEEELKAELRAELEAEAEREEALREEIRSELEAETNEQSESPKEPVSSQDTNQNNDQNSVSTGNDNPVAVRDSLTNQQIEVIASDLVAGLELFSASTPAIDATMAETFAYFLVFIKDEQHILDNYISSMENLVSDDVISINDGTADGRYIKALGEALFYVSINPESTYAFQPFDPALTEVELVAVENNGSKYIARLDVIDVMGNPYLSMELHLSLTPEGYTRIEYISTEDVTSQPASQTGAIVDIKDLKAGMPFNDLTVGSISYNPGDQLMVELTGRLGFEGNLHYDDYFGAFYFESESYEFFQKIKIGDDTILQLPAGFVIKNEDVLRDALGQQIIDKMKNDINYSPYAVVIIKSYTYGVKLSESYQDSAAELLEILEIQE